MAEQKKEFITGDGRAVGIQQILDLYREVLSESKPSSGKIKPIFGTNNYILTSNYDTLDCDQLEMLKCSKTHLLTIEDEGGMNKIRTQPVVETNGPVDLTSSYSKTGKHLARIKNNSKGADKNNQILEIWGRSRLIKSIDVSEIETHGAINTDPVFSSFCWSKSDESKLLYVCERKRPKQQGYFKQDHASSKDSDNFGQKHNRREDWGECLADIEHTILAVLDVANGCKVNTIDMDGYSLGDAQWINDSQTVSVAYPEEPRRLGLIYCNSRPSILVIHDWSYSPPKEIRRIQDIKLSFTNPRVCEKSGRFVCLATPTYGAHKHAQMMYLCTDTDNKLLVNELFIDSLPKNCFLCDDRYILFLRSSYVLPSAGAGYSGSEIVSLCQQLCLYDLVDLNILDTALPSAGIQLLDIRDDVIFAAGSDINVPPSLYVSKLCPNQLASKVEWHAIDPPRKIDEVIFRPFKLPTPDDTSFISGFLVSPDLENLHKVAGVESKSLIQVEKDLPTVVLIHGGPHSAVSRTFVPGLIVYAKLGLRALIINYRGSTGVSEEYLDCLCGRAGELDVNDCLLAIRHFVQIGIINPNKLIVQGGSHGGFLAAHLSCQKEFKFTSAIIRNPVIDISTLHTTADIPDWCYTEALGTRSYDPSWLPGAQELTKMFECSPLSKYRDAYVPTLMLLGSQDKRVPMFQGERWYQLLKARGVKTQCKVYEDKHDLAKPESAVDGNITAIIWIFTNLENNVGTS